MDASIHGGSKCAIRFNVSVATVQFVAHLVIKRTNQVVGKFSYPARDGYQTLTKDTNDYVGLLTSEMTALFPTEQLRIEAKPFIDTNTAPIGSADVRRIKDNTVKTIETI